MGAAICSPVDSPPPLAPLRYRRLARSRTPLDRDLFNERLSALGDCLETMAGEWRTASQRGHEEDQALVEELAQCPHGDATLVMETLMDRVAEAIEIYLRSALAYERLRAIDTLRLELLAVSVRYRRLQSNFAPSLKRRNLMEITDFIAREAQDLAMEFTLVWEPDPVSYRLEMGAKHPRIVRVS